MQTVMTSDETQIQIFANWPMSHAKRVTRDNRKSPEYRVIAAIRKLRTDTNCPAGKSWPNHQIFYRSYVYRQHFRLRSFASFQLLQERLSYKRGKAYATMSKVIMGNGGCLSEREGVSAWWNETAQTRIRSFSFLDAESQWTTSSKTKLLLPIMPNGLVACTLLHFCGTTFVETAIYIYIIWYSPLFCFVQHSPTGNRGSSDPIRVWSRNRMLCLA